MTVDMDGNWVICNGCVYRAHLKSFALVAFNVQLSSYIDSITILHKKSIFLSFLCSMSNKSNRFMVSLRALMSVILKLKQIYRTKPIDTRQYTYISTIMEQSQSNSKIIQNANQQKNREHIKKVFYMQYNRRKEIKRSNSTRTLLVMVLWTF